MVALVLCHEVKYIIDRKRLIASGKILPVKLAELAAHIVFIVKLQRNSRAQPKVFGNAMAQVITLLCLK